MKIQSRLLTSIWLAVLTVCLINSQCQVFAADGKEKAGKPNIVFILTDDQRLEDIQHMPILNRLMVKEGACFDNYFSSVALCCPSRISILRGQYAHNTGVETNGGSNGGFETAHRLGVEDSTVATWMQSAGYKTALIGKYLNHYPGKQGPEYVPPGWDYWASSVKGNAYSEYNYTLNENGKQVRYDEKPEDYGTDVYTGKAVQFIKSCATDKRPFFVYLAFYAPHGPATPAPRHLKMFSDARVPRTKAFNESDVSKKPSFIRNLAPLSDAEVSSEDAYYGKRLRSLQAVDEAIETIHKALQDSKLLDNTYMVFATDNGFHLGEHRMRRGKQTAYETDIHLPLIVRGPGVIPGSKPHEIAGNIDLAPTFAALGGAKVPDFIDGRSLEPLLHGTEDKSAWRKSFLIEHWKMGNGGGGKRRMQTATLASPAIKSTKVVTAVENAEKSDDEPSQDMTDEQTVAAANASAPNTSLVTVNADAATSQPGIEQNRRKNERIKRRMAMGGSEALGIPELHAVRTLDTTYVEYITGEQEYYKLLDDEIEINNVADKLTAEELKTKSAQLEELKKGTAQAVRRAEQR